MRPLTLATFILATCVPATAGETPWQQVAPDVSMRLISSGTLTPDGEGFLAIEIDMPESTKTYWRVPGQTGLAIDLDFTGSDGVVSHRIEWPYPLRELKSGYLDYVYYGRTVLPIVFNTTAPEGAVQLEATLGICSDICIPAKARFSLPARDADADTANGLRIRQAIAEAPLDWTEGASPFGEVHLTGDPAGITIEINDAGLDVGSVIAATVEGAPLFGAPQKSPQTDLVVLPIIGKTDNSALDGADVELTFMTEQGAYRVVRTIEAGGDIEASR